MPELPSGTVTFLFTDVEGSTRLLHELGADEYAQARTGNVHADPAIVVRCENNTNKVKRRVGL